MNNESEVEIITDKINIKKMIGYSYITGYTLGTFIGYFAAPQNVRNNVTKYNRYLGNLFATGSAIICAACYMKNKLNSKQNL